jgi:hypothetical protein
MNIGFWIDNFGAIISLVFILIIVYMAVKEFYLSSNSGGVITNHHLHLHRNIILQATIALVVMMYGIYGLTLTPIDYIISAENLDKALILKDGVYHIDYNYFKSDEIETLIRGFGSKYMLMASFGMLVFFYVALDHLSKERRDAFGDDEYLATHDVIDKDGLYNNLPK